MHGRARRESAGKQFAARRAGVRRTGSGEHAQREGHFGKGRRGAGAIVPARCQSAAAGRRSDPAIAAADVGARRLAARCESCSKSIDLTAAARYADAVPSAQWTRREYEARSLARVARAIVVCALAREESRGAHYRNDFPQRDDARFGTHSHLIGDSVSFGPLLPVQHSSVEQPESPALR